VDVGEAALFAGVEVFASAEPLGHGGFDGHLDRADAVVGGEVGGEVVGRVGEAETHGSRLVEGLVGYLGSQLVGVDDVHAKVVDDGAVQCRAMLPAAVGDVLTVGLHRFMPDDRAGCAALGAGLDIGVEVGATAATHDRSFGLLAGGSVDASGGGVDAFGEGGVDVNHGADVGIGGAGDHGQGGFVYKVAAVGAGDVTAEDLVGRMVDDELDEADGLVHRPGLGDPVESLGADGDVVARVAGLLFGESDRADFGVNEHGVRYDAVGDCAVAVSVGVAVDGVGVVAGGVGEHGPTA